VSIDGLDPVIHGPTRLRIMVTLATLPEGDDLSFSRLQDLLSLTPGNLITHLRKLEDAGYVTTVNRVHLGARQAIFAARHPGKIRTLTLTNCDCEGNFPPPDFAPVIEQARQGTLAPLMAELAANPQTWPTNPLTMGYQYPDRVPQDAWRDYLTGTAGTIERARDCERLLASLDAADIEAAGGQLRALDVPTLLVWGTADTMFAVKWAYHLRDLIPGAREVIEIDGAKIFFPEERPEDLIPHLRRHWGR
jgi:pimeloyl-ACP methyl ester carboxylesterase